MMTEALRNARLALRRLMNTRGSYRAALLETGDAGRVVLADLYEFCGAGECSVKPEADAIDVARREGRREVFLHVQYMLHMSADVIGRMQHEISNDQEMTDHVS